MPEYTVQVQIPTVDNVLANYASNTFHISADDATDLNDAMDAIIDFYGMLTSTFSSFVRQTNWEINGYDNSDTPPRAPVLTRIFSLGAAPSGSPLPPEVALVLSFQSSRVSGIPQARRRGRVYIPFIDASLNGTDGRPNSTVIASLVAAGEYLLDRSLDPAEPWLWTVYSRTSGQSDTVLNGWVDNEWDTQRRRGRPSTSRTTFTA